MKNETKTIGKIRPIKESEEKNFLKQENVTGVDIGKKIVAGEDTDELAIIIYVKEKKDKKKLKKDELIPENIKGIKTDVIEMNFVLQDLPDYKRYDPPKGGISIGNGRYNTIGTLGAVVKDNISQEFMLLSCFHVFCKDDQYRIGDTIYQPPSADKNPDNIIGRLKKAVLNQNVDCAVSNIIGRTDICLLEIEEVGQITETSNASPGLPVRKRGYTTGLTYGTVESTDLSCNINFENLGWKRFYHQIKIKPDTSHNHQFCERGDSGSLVVNDSNQIIGLCFASADSYPLSSIANPIEPVLNALNVRFDL